jgi:hypothetical protein
MPTKRTWMPIAGGALSIVSGAVEILGGITAGTILTTLVAMPGIGAIAGFPLVILGIVAIVGGVFSIRRRIWGLALAGAICSLLLPTITILGILAIIFIAMSKKEFGK